MTSPANAVQASDYTPGNKQGRKIWAFGGILVLIVLCMYALTRTQQHTSDDIQKAMAVDNAVGNRMWHPASIELEMGEGRGMNPRYLLEIPLTARLSRLLRGLGWVDRTVVPIQLSNVLFAAVGTLALYWALTRIASALLALVLSLGLTSSYGWWYYSTHADFVIAGMALVTVMLAMVIVLLQARSRRAIVWLSCGLGVATSLAIMFYLTSLIFLPVLLFALWLRFWRELRDPSLGVLALTIGGLAAVVTVITTSTPILLTHVEGASSVSEMVRRAVYWDNTASIWYSVELGDVPRALFGISKSFIRYPFLGNLAPGDYFSQASTRDRALMLMWSGVQLAIFVLPVGLLLRRWNSLGRLRATTLVLFGWILIQMPFGILWVPTEVKWWLGILPAWLVLVAIAARVYSGNASERRAGRAIISLFVLASFGVNLATEFWPKAQIEPMGPREEARVIAASTSPEALLISTGASELEFYLPYFEGRRVISYPLAAITWAGDEMYVQERIGLVVEAYLNGGSSVYIFNCNGQQAGKISSALTLSISAAENIVLPADWSAAEKTICEISDS